jgi:subtilisin-like proprotein convertase family protein
MTQPSIGHWPAVLILALAMIVSAGAPTSTSTSRAQQALPGVNPPEPPGIASGSTVINVSSTPLNSSILDNSLMFASINIPAGNVMSIVDVNVRVRIDHEAAGDIDMYLIAPNGTTVQLATDVGSLDNDFGAGAPDCSGVFTTFDDESPVLIAAASAPFVGSFRPEGSLSAFDGKPHTGTWLLQITDDQANGQTGTLYCWELTIRRTAIGKAFTISDGRTELNLWRPSTARVYARNLAAVVGSIANGQANDLPVPADYTGDGLEEALALFRPSTGQWFNTGSVATFGINNDVPVPGDYNGDGSADIAVWRPSEGNWYLRNIATISWGVAGDIPVPADYNGDGTTDLAVWRPSDGVWYIRNITNVQWGSPGDIPVPADYTGDGKADVAVFRPSTGYWHIVSVDQQQINAIPWGGMNDIPIPADYDGDGKADIAVFRGSDGFWHIRNVGAILWGTTGDIPLTKRPTYPGYPY